MGEASRGRALRFEQCESRLALSTTAFVATPVAAQIDVEGGQISLDSAFLSHFYSLATTRDATPTGLTFTAGDDARPVEQHSFGGGDRLNITARPPGGLILSTGNVISRDGDPFGAFDQVMSDADFSTPELFGADSALVGSAIRPISPPTGEAPSNDGGSIALDPFTRPEGLQDLTPAGLNSVAGAANTERVVSPRPAATESLRGRAVVFEVAHSQGAVSGAASLRLASHESRNTEVAYLVENDSLTHAAAAATRSDRTDADTAESPTPTRNARQRGDSHRDQELLSDESLMAAFAPDNAPMQSTEATSEQASSATANADASRGAAHDAALAGWSSRGDGETDVAVAPLDPAVSHRTMVGALLALVAGTAPFSKRFRGLLAKTTTVERPRRRRA